MRGIHGGDIYRNQIEMDFSVNGNPLGIPESVVEALQQAIKQCEKYPDIEAEALKRAVSSMQQLPMEYYLFGNGASELFMAVVHALKPEKILLPVPSFYGYEYVAKATNSDIVYYPFQEADAFLPTDDLLQMLTEDMDVLFLANPNNPTGKRIEQNLLKKILRICKENHIVVILDECFIDFCGSEYSMKREIENYENLLLIQAFTKIFAIPGVRLGYLISSNENLLRDIARQLPEWNMSVFAQKAGVACCKETAYVSKTLEYVRTERQYLAAGLRKMGCKVYETEANYILFFTEIPIFEKLLDRGILIRDCQNYKGLSKGFYRVAVKQRKENEKLLKAMGECIE